MASDLPLRPQVDLARCTGCGLCARACPCGAIQMTDGGPQFACAEACRHDPSCPALAHCFWPCEAACPCAALHGTFEIAGGS